MKSNKMDERCPRGLKHLPGSWCAMAVLRLKAIRNAGRELTESEENALPGCPWAISHQLANYCFFQYGSEFNNSASEQVSYIEIAGLLCISEETVKKIEKTGIAKMKEFHSFKELQQNLSKGESVIDERSSFDDDALYV